MSRLGGLSFRHGIGPQPPIRPIVEVKELRGPAVIEPNFIAATVLDGFVFSEVYIDHAPMMPWADGWRKSSTRCGAELLSSTAGRGGCYPLSR